MPGSRSIRLASAPLSPQKADEVSRYFSALSDPVRLRLFDLIRRAGKTGVCSCDLVELLDRSQPTVSHHLKVLREVGLIEHRRDKTWMWYSIVPGALDHIEGFIHAMK